MKQQLVYQDSVIEVALFDDDDNNEIKRIGIKYLKPKAFKGKDGSMVEINNIMNGETDWFILPVMFSNVIGKKLFEQHNAGLIGFENQGISALKSWLLEFEIIDDCMTY